MFCLHLIAWFAWTLMWFLNDFLQHPRDHLLALLVPHEALRKLSRNGNRHWKSIEMGKYWGISSDIDCMVTTTAHGPLEISQMK